MRAGCACRSVRVTAGEEQTKQQRRHAAAERDRGLRNETVQKRLAAVAKPRNERIDRHHPKQGKNRRERDDVRDDQDRAVGELAPESSALKPKRAMPKLQTREMHRRSSRHESFIESSTVVGKDRAGSGDNQY